MAVDLPGGGRNKVGWWMVRSLYQGGSEVVMLGNHVAALSVPCHVEVEVIHTGRSSWAVVPRHFSWGHMSFLVEVSRKGCLHTVEVLQVFSDVHLYVNELSSLVSGEMELDKACFSLCLYFDPFL